MAKANSPTSAGATPQKSKTGRRIRPSSKRILKDEYEFEERLELNFINLHSSSASLQMLLADVKARASDIIEHEHGERPKGPPSEYWARNMAERRATGAAYAYQLFDRMAIPLFQKIELKDAEEQNKTKSLEEVLRDLVAAQPNAVAELILLGIALGSQMIRMEIAHWEFTSKGGHPELTKSAAGDLLSRFDAFKGTMPGIKMTSVKESFAAKLGIGVRGLEMKLATAKRVLKESSERN